MKKFAASEDSIITFFIFASNSFEQTSFMNFLLKFIPLFTAALQIEWKKFLEKSVLIK